jgi:holin-like protein
MEALRGLALLLLCQSAGEAAARGLGLPLPGPVLGMLLMLALLAWPAVRAPVAAAADGLLQHLSLLFVPVGVGVITHVAIVAQYGLRIALVVLVSTLAGLAVTAWVLQACLRPGAFSAEPPRAEG